MFQNDTLNPQGAETDRSNKLRDLIQKSARSNDSSVGSPSTARDGTGYATFRKSKNSVNYFDQDTDFSNVM